MRSKSYSRDPRWAIALLDDVSAWVETLPARDYEQVIAALDALAYEGPNLGRPFVDHIKGSRHRNMKELRPRSTNIRLLFAFDPTRQAIVLVGGDKTGDWDRWYLKNIPVADALFDEHLSNVDKGN